MINSAIYLSFQATLIALGLFTDQTKAQFCMQEAMDTLHTPHWLCILFVHLLTYSCTNTLLQLWNKFWDKFSEDLILNTIGDVEWGYNKTLKTLGLFLWGHGKYLGDYGLPQPMADKNKIECELCCWLLQATALWAQVHTGLWSSNSEQWDIFQQVQFVILTDKPLLMFIDGKVGCGKIFLVNTLCSWVCSTGRIVLPTATFGFTAQLYPSGKTTHLTFGISSYLIINHFHPTQPRPLLMNATNFLSLLLNHTSNVANYFEGLI